jgi:hypothetical protein
MPIMNACVKENRMVEERECKACTGDCRHAGEPTTAERIGSKPELEFLGRHFDRIVIEPEAGGAPIASITRNGVELATGYVARCLPSNEPNP